MASTQINFVVSFFFFQLIAFWVQFPNKYNGKILLTTVSSVSTTVCTILCLIQKNFYSS